LEYEHRSVEFEAHLHDFLSEHGYREILIAYHEVAIVPVLILDGRILDEDHEAQEVFNEGVAAFKSL